MAESKYKKKYYREETTKKDLIEFLAHTEGISKHKAGVIVNRIIEFIVIHLGSLNKVKISGLGSLLPSYVKARKSYIPKGNVKKWLPPKLKITLTLEPPIKETLNKQADRFRKLFAISDPYMDTLALEYDLDDEIEEEDDS